MESSDTWSTVDAVYFYDRKFCVLNEWEAHQLNYALALNRKEERYKLMKLTVAQLKLVEKTRSQINEMTTKCDELYNKLIDELNCHDDDEFIWEYVYNCCDNETYTDWVKNKLNEED